MVLYICDTTENIIINIEVQYIRMETPNVFQGNWVYLIENNKLLSYVQALTRSSDFRHGGQDNIKLVRYLSENYRF